MEVKTEGADPPYRGSATPADDPAVKDEGEDAEQAADSDPPATFNGALERFQFTRRAITRSMSASKPPQQAQAQAPPSPTTAKAKASRKRKLSQPTPAPGPTLPTTSIPTSASASPSPKKKKSRRPASGYAPPSRYAHLPLLPDRIAPRLILLFVGLNPGIRTATSGHAYSHPSNLFWKLLHSSGCTPGARRLDPSEDVSLPARFGLGNTNIVARPSRDQAELSRAEMEAGVAVLEQKVRTFRPEAVCLVGKSIWEAVWKVRKGRAMRTGEFEWGWQGDGERLGVVTDGGDGGSNDAEAVGAVKEEREADGEWKGARVFVATSTSGLAASLRPHEKEAIWKPLGEWVQKRRLERGEWLDCGAS